MAALAVWTASASADPLPTWTYQHVANVVLRDPAAGSGLSLPNSPSATVKGDGLATIDLVQWSVAAADAPDRVAAEPYSFSLTLTDAASKESGTASFVGAMSGTYWKGGADLTNRFTEGTVRVVALGEFEYRVSLVEFTPPTVAGVAGAGRITAQVTVSEAGGGGDSEPTSPSATPEPATVLLAAVGLAAVTRVRRRLTPPRTAVA